MPKSLKKQKPPVLKYFLILPVLFLLISIIGIVKKIEYLSSDPIKEKDCPPIFPKDSASNILKYKTIELRNFILLSQRGGTINDASCLNRTGIYGIVKVFTVEDIRKAIIFAQENNLKVSVAGVRHSMGGQAFSKDALVLDMTGFNMISVDQKNKILTVQSGAIWHDIQKYLNTKGLAIKSMQSIDIFTVGGSISVNGHGINYKVGSIASTIRSMTLMLADGKIVTISHTQDPQLFKSVIGGYGLFGVILDAKLDVVDNNIYKQSQKVINYKDFLRVYKNLNSNKNIDLMFTNFSVAPQNFLKDMTITTYEITDYKPQAQSLLNDQGEVRLRRFLLNFSKTGVVGREIKWLAERYLAPRFQNCYKPRDIAMTDSEQCLVSRNESMHDSVKYLKNNLQNDTDILQEYFIPQNKIVPFVDGVRAILLKNKTNLINAGIRVVNKEDISLNYAPENMFALVLYINQETTPEANQKMEKVTKELIDHITKMKGTFYLP